MAALATKITSTIAPIQVAEESTTEEEECSALEETSSQASEADADAEEEALRRYYALFSLAGNSRPSNAHRFENQVAFDWRVRGDWDTIRATNKSQEQVLEELDRDMATLAGVSNISLERLEIEESSRNADSKVLGNSSLELNPTFGYAGSLDEHPPFARFDVRDHVCLKVGGFRHGQVVRVRSGAEMVVIGVREVEGTPLLWFQPKSLGRPGAGTFRGTSTASLRLRVTQLDREPETLRDMKPDEFFAGEDPDGEDYFLCRGCRLPVGITCYLYGDKKEVPVHGECLEHILLHDCLEVEREQKAADAATKQQLRKEYDIGWRAGEVPRNMVAAMKLGCDPVPRGMCCLVFNEQAQSAWVAPTLEPAASINLEYLALALQVRLHEGREPLFSLDVVNHQGEWTRDKMQAKRFEPEWLAGSSVGDVLFQADYHLKELSMGECEQPIVGMKNCIELQEVLESKEEMKEWSAREWFVVRKAEVLINEDNILIPRVSMGVEAREQVLVNDEEDDQFYLVDKTMTRSNHPMVKYAKEFTRQFDLIAERKSVIYHLRELAKASVLAKMLIEAGINMQQSWLELASEEKLACALEVPQLWNDRLYTRIQASANGIEVLSDKDRSHGVYGGVNFGLQQQTIAMPSQVTRGRLIGVSSTARPAAAISAMASPAVSLAGGRAGLGLGLSAMAPAPPAAALPQSHSGSSIGGLGLSALTAPAASALGVLQPVFQQPQGVLHDLRAGGWIAPGVSIHTITTVGKLPKRDLALPILEARAIMAGVLNPGRPMIGPTMLSYPEMFIPAGEEIPAPADPRGVDLNLDQFNLSRPTKVQGHCWADGHEAVKCAPLGAAFWSSLDATDAASFASLHESDLKLLQAIFNPNLCDRREEGDQFVPPDSSHKYVERLRSLVQEEDQVREKRRTHFFSPDFSIAFPSALFPKSWEPSIEIASKPQVQTGQLIARPDYKAFSQKLEHALKLAPAVFDKMTEEGLRFRIYQLGHLEVRTTQEPSAVEEIGSVYSRTCDVGAAPETAMPAARCHDEKVVHVTQYVEGVHDSHRWYVVLKTNQGRRVVTEMLANGQVFWDERPMHLEFRNSLAKVMRSQDCHEHRIPLRDVEAACARESAGAEHASSLLKSQWYARYAYRRATGTDCEPSCFYRRQHGLEWQFSEKKYGLYSAGNGEDDEERPPATASKDGKSLTLGDMVQVRATGRIGKVMLFDGSETPYKVSFGDGLSPKNKWFQESDLQRACT